MNLRELASHIESPLFLTHIRAAIGSPVQQTNCHPFRHGRWLFVHNGYVGDFHHLRRDLMLALDPEHFAAVQGSTDTEVVFRLALTHGLEDDPLAAMARTIGHVEESARRLGQTPMVQGTFGISDGESVWAVRYATEGTARTLFASSDVEAVQKLYPDNKRLGEMRAHDRLIVSEPFSDLPGVWEEIPQSSSVRVAADGVFEHQDFRPLVPVG